MVDDNTVAKKHTISIGGPKKPAEPVEPPHDYQKDVKNLSRRLRVLEDRFGTMHTKIQLIEENMLSQTKRLNVELKTLESDDRELKKEFLGIKDKLLSVISELDSFSRREEVLVLKKYVDYWEPVKFITRNELNDRLELFKAEIKPKKEPAPSEEVKKKPKKKK